MKPSVKAVVAVDSFKGCLSSMEAGKAVAEGIRRAFAEGEETADVAVYPLADGGEGTVEALVCGMRGRLHTITVTGPLGEPVDCSYGVIEEGGGIEQAKVAIIEMAGAAGLTLVPVEKRNPMYTTTYGVGEVIKDAVEKGCRRLIVGIGGSATNDGGAGMLQALGYGFLDEEGMQIPFGAEGLGRLAAITEENALPQLKECEFRVACDVTNVLCGKQGCSAVYAPQKGADDEMIVQMDKWLAHYAALAGETYRKANPSQAGAGAAGGLGFAFLTFLNAKLESGIGIVLKETGLEKDIKEADIVITGEGRLDGQTAMGKAPSGVAALAKQYGKPVVALAGSVTGEAVLRNQRNIDAFFSILREPATLEAAMDLDKAKENLTATAEQVVRLWRVGRGFLLAGQ